MEIQKWVVVQQFAIKSMNKPSRVLHPGEKFTVEPHPLGAYDPATIRPLALLRIDNDTFDVSIETYARNSLRLE